MSDDQRPGDPPEDGEEERPPESSQPPEDASGPAEEAPAPPASDDAADPPPEKPLDTEETGRLGLTEEFERIEAEIEQDAAPAGEEGAADADDAADDAEAPAEDAEAPAEEADDAPAEAADVAPAEDQDEPAEDEAEEAEEAAGNEPEPPAREEDQAPATIAPADRVLPQRPVVRPMPRPAVPIAAAAISDEELEIKTPSLWWRFLAGSVVIVMSVAAAVSVVGLLFLSDVAAKLQPIPGIQEQLEPYESGEPQTILIIGSDYREGDAKDNARSDTTMLLRVDPDGKILSLFSLPRDLKVFIPGVGEGRLNEAYTLGGEKKTLKTVKAFTGLDINVVVEINFSGFAEAVNAIDCVYVDVDRDYFNDNSDGGDDYAAIDINAGYQRLCGEKALQYVRYRHTDTDLVRAARQQDFLREARQKVEPRELLGAVIGVGTGSELIDIFTDYTRSSIDDEAQIIDVLKSFIAVQSAPVNEVHFEGDIGSATDTYVTSTDEQVKTAIDQFLNGVGSEGQRGGEEAAAKPEEEQEDKPKEEKPKPEPEPEDLADGAAVVGTDALTDVKFSIMSAHLERDAKKNQKRLPIPVFYPTVAMPGSAFSTGSRTYEYENEDNKKEDAYKTVIAWTTPSTLTEYYGVMGTTWDDPPILRNPSETREIDGRDYMLFYDGDRLRMVGWREAGASYWLNNTLSQSIGEAEMLAIATSMKQA